MKKLAFREGLVSFRNVDVKVVRKCGNCIRVLFFRILKQKHKPTIIFKSLGYASLTYFQLQIAVSWKFRHNWYF